MIEDIRYAKPGAIGIIALVILMVLMFLYFDYAVAEDRDPKATEIAEKTIQAMGGMDA